MPLRVAIKDDVPELFKMVVVELAVFEKLDSQVIMTQEQFVKDFEDGCFSAFIAIDDETGKTAGMVIYHNTYDCWNGRTMSMDELIVRPEYRNKKYGKQLWAAVAQEAKEEGVAHLSWDILDWNEPAIRFYNSVAGVSEDKSEDGILRYKMSRVSIAQFATANLNDKSK